MMMNKSLIVTYLMALLFVGKASAQIKIKNAKTPTARFSAEEKKKFLAQKGKDEVWFYEHANYQGKKFVLSRGKYTLANLGVSANDFFSSALIPSHLTVVVYMDDNVLGNWLMLSPDDANYGFNADFAAINKYRYWQTPNGDPISGIANINDMISSICITDPSKDLVSVYADCAYRGRQIQLTALPNYNHNTVSNYRKNLMDMNYGWDLEQYQFAKIASSVQLSGVVESVDLWRDDKGGREALGNIPCLNAIQLLYRGKAQGDFNDNLSAITINLKPGPVRIYQ